LRTRALVQNLGWITLASMAVGYVTARGGPGGGEGNRGKAGDPSGAARGGGATAVKPTEIPLSGWIGIAKRTYAEIGSDRVLAVAAGVTFYALLALFPAITALVSLYGLVADPGTIVEHLAAIERFLPAGAVDILRDQITRIAEGGETRLSLAFGISVALALWSANAGVKAVFDALNVAYGETEKRGFIRLNLTSLAFTLAIILFVLMAIAATAVVPVLLDVLPLGQAVQWLISIGRWPLLIVILMLGLAVLYRFGPSRDAAKWAWVSPGAIVASIGWLLGSLLFSWYVANFEDYNKTYGALGALIGLLTWMWLSATIVLVGAELNSETERQTLRDTTKGTPKPIGARGADAADSKRI
jgi:membrane protein